MCFLAQCYHFYSTEKRLFSSEAAAFFIKSYQTKSFIEKKSIFILKSNLLTNQVYKNESSDYCKTFFGGNPKL